MAIQIECDDCGKRYKLDDSAAGKRGKCRKCGNVFTIPAPGARKAETVPLAAVGVAADRSGEPTRRARSRRVRTDPPADLGFNLKELADLERTGTVDDQYQLAPLAPPPLAAAKGPARPIPMPIGVPQRRAEAQASSFGKVTRLLPWVGLGLLVLLVAGITLLSGSIATGMFGALAIMGLIIMITGGVWAVIVAFRESAVCGVLYILVPFYWLYYLITRWEEMKRPFGIATLGWLLTFVAGFLAPS